MNLQFFAMESWKRINSLPQGIDSCLIQNPTFFGNRPSATTDLHDKADEEEPRRVEAIGQGCLALGIPIRARGDRAELAADHDVLVDGVDEAGAPWH